MYKKVVFSLLVVSFMSLSLEANLEDLQKEILDVKSKINTLKVNLKSLEAQLPPNNQLITHTEIGYINTKGNTKTDAFSIDANAKKPYDRHLFEFSIDAQYAKDSDIESKNRYFVELEYNYNIKNKFSLNYTTGYKRDKFSSFKYQFYSGPGSKYKVYKSTAQDLTIEGNIQYAIDRLEDIKYASDGSVITYPNSAGIATSSIKKGPTNSYASYRAKSVYIWQIADNLKFNQELSYRSEVYDKKNYFVFSKTALTSKLLEMFSAGLSYKVDYTNMPAQDKGYTDRTLSVNIIIDY